MKYVGRENNSSQEMPTSNDSHEIDDRQKAIKKASITCWFFFPSLPPTFPFSFCPWGRRENERKRRKRLPSSQLDLSTIYPFAPGILTGCDQNDQVVSPRERGEKSTFKAFGPQRLAVGPGHREIVKEYILYGLVRTAPLRDGGRREREKEREREREREGNLNKHQHQDSIFCPRRDSEKHSHLLSEKTVSFFLFFLFCLPVFVGLSLFLFLSCSSRNSLSLFCILSLFQYSNCTLSLSFFLGVIKSIFFFLFP